jgi:RNA 2',3'-cyclic 3'-phosphodiesterase
VTSTGSVERDERLRLFLALRLPEDVLDTVVAWQRLAIPAGRPVPRENLHVTLAFLGSRPRAELRGILECLRGCAGGSQPFELAVDGYRETRSVGMLTLDDPRGGAARLAACVHQGLEEQGVYRREQRPWLPHITVVRFHERPRLRPPLPQLDPFAPSDAAAFLSRLHPTGATYEVLESFALAHDKLGRLKE